MSICNPSKYIYALPFYRQEKYFKMLDVDLSRQTLLNWMIDAANEFTVVYDLMKNELLKLNYIQADKTTLKVIYDKGKVFKSLR